jgi:hypothetical protein
MEEEHVIFNGIRVPREWLENQDLKAWLDEVIEAQSDRLYSIGGVTYERIIYGSEKDDRGAEEHDCRDCGIAKGLFHLPGCDVEECPKCGARAISCGCDYDTDGEEG